MNLKKWPLFADWEEIFGKDRAFGEFAEGPEDAVEEIERIESQEITNGMSMGFPIDVVGIENASAQEKIKLLKRNLMYQLEQHKVHLLLKLNLMNQLEQHKVHSPLQKVKPINLRKRATVLKHHLLKSTKKVDAKKEKQLKMIMRLFLKV